MANKDLGNLTHMPHQFPYEKSKHQYDEASDLNYPNEVFTAFNQQLINQNFRFPKFEDIEEVYTQKFSIFFTYKNRLYRGVMKTNLHGEAGGKTIEFWLPGDGLHLKEKYKTSKVSHSYNTVWDVLDIKILKEFPSMTSCADKLMKVYYSLVLYDYNGVKLNIQFRDNEGNTLKFCFRQTNFSNDILSVTTRELKHSGLSLSDLSLRDMTQPESDSDLNFPVFDANSQEKFQVIDEYLRKFFKFDLNESTALDFAEFVSEVDEEIRDHYSPYQWAVLLLEKKWDRENLVRKFKIAYGTITDPINNNYKEELIFYLKELALSENISSTYASYIIESGFPFYCSVMQWVNNYLEFKYFYPNNTFPSAKYKLGERYQLTTENVTRNVGGNALVINIKQDKNREPLDLPKTIINQLRNIIPAAQSESIMLLFNGSTSECAIEIQQIGLNEDTFGKSLFADFNTNRSFYLGRSIKNAIEWSCVKADQPNIKPAILIYAITLEQLTEYTSNRSSKNYSLDFYNIQNPITCGNIVYEASQTGAEQLWHHLIGFCKSKRRRNIHINELHTKLGFIRGPEQRNSLEVDENGQTIKWRGGLLK